MNRRIAAAILAAMAEVTFGQDMVRAADVSREDLRVETEAIVERAAALDAAWFGRLNDLVAAARARGVKEPLLKEWRFELPKALGQTDLTVSLLRCGDEWLPGRAWAPKWNGAVHRIDAPALVVEARGESETVKGELAIRIVPDNRTPDGSDYLDPYGAPLILKYKVEGTVQAGTIRGHGSVADGPVGTLLFSWNGAITGRVMTLDGTPKPPADQLRYSCGDKDAYVLYAAAVRAEVAAAASYRGIRAIVLARDGGLSYSNAIELAPLLIPERASFLSVAAAKKEQHKKSLEKRGAPSLDDLATDGDFGDLGAPSAPKAEPSKGSAKSSLAVDARAPAALATLKVIRASIERMLAAVETDASRGKDAPPVLVGGPWGLEDPHFGPWFGRVPLSVDKQNVNLLPADVGGAGPQQWRHIGRWTVSGAIPPWNASTETPALPELILEGTGSATALFEGGRKVEWAARSASAGTAHTGYGYVIPAPWDPKELAVVNEYWPGDRLGQDKGFLAEAILMSPSDVELRVCLEVYGGARLWMNDMLTWQTHLEPERGRGFFFRKLKFRKGNNRLLFRCDAETRKGASFAMHVCTQGQPRAPEAVAAFQRGVDTRLASFANERLYLTGWRGGRMGQFTDCNPPLAWDLKRGINVLWRTKTPLFSNNTAVLAGDRLFTKHEPCVMRCLDLASGKELWWRAINANLLYPDVNKENFMKLLETYVNEGMTMAQRHELVRLQHEVAAAERAGRGVTQEQKQRIEDLKAMDERTKPIAESYWNTNQKYGGFRFDRGYIVQGWTMSTPVTDGTNVWVLCGARAVACLDMQGNTRWMREYPSKAGGAGEVVPSVVLIGDTLVLKVDAPRKDFPWKENERSIISKWRPEMEEDGGQCLMAVNAATGDLRWLSPAFHISGNGVATPAPVHLTNGKEDMVAMVAGSGALVRFDDGKLLISDMGCRMGHATPTILGDTVVADPVSIQLIMLDRDTVGARIRWHNLNAYASSGFVLDGDLACAYVGDAGEQRCRRFDIRTGRTVEESGIVFRAFWGCYPPHIVTDRHVYLCSTGGGVAALERGRGGIHLATSPYETGGMYSSPVCRGDRMYLNTRTEVICIGYTGDEGRAFEAKTVAATLLDGMFPELPGTPEPVAIPPAAMPAGTPVVRLRVGEAPLKWLCAGPFPADAGGSLLQSLDGQLRSCDIKLGGSITAGTVKRDWRTADCQPSERALRHRLDASEHVNGQAGDVVLVYAVWDREEAGIVRLDQRTDGVDLFLNGMPVKHGQRLALKEGRYGLLARIKLSDAAAGARAISPRFWVSDDVKAERTSWTELARKVRSHLERVVKLAPDSDEAKSAARLLEGLGPG